MSKMSELPLVSGEGRETDELLVVRDGAARRILGGAYLRPSWDHIGDICNPHKVTAEQIGAVSKEALESLLENNHFLPDGGEPGQILRVQEDGSFGWEVPVWLETSSACGVVLDSEGNGGGLWSYIDEEGVPVMPPKQTFFENHAVWGNIQDVVIDGQRMVKIPRFYVRRGIIQSGAKSGKEGWWISALPRDGYHLHPAFRLNGEELDQVYVGKYQACLDGARIGSRPGAMPAVNKTHAQFQTAAAARNVSGVSGFMLWNIFHLSAIQWLYLLEHATMDSQTKSGLGRVSATSMVTVDALDVAQASYRGLVGLWGNVWQWIDGVKTVSGSICVMDCEGNQPWLNTGQIPQSLNGWIYPLTFMDVSDAGFDMGDVFLAKSGPAQNTGATAPDGQFWRDEQENLIFVGGHWGLGNGAGLWCSASGAVSYSCSDVGARLAKI